MISDKYVGKTLVYDQCTDSHTSLLVSKTSCFTCSDVDILLEFPVAPRFLTASSSLRNLVISSSFCGAEGDELSVMPGEEGAPIF